MLKDGLDGVVIGGVSIIPMIQTIVADKVDNPIHSVPITQILGSIETITLGDISFIAGVCWLALRLVTGAIDYSLKKRELEKSRNEAQVDKKP